MLVVALGIPPALLRDPGLAILEGGLSPDLAGVVMVRSQVTLVDWQRLNISKNDLVWLDTCDKWKQTMEELN